MMKDCFTMALFVSFLVLIISEAVIGANDNDLIVVESDSEETNSDSPSEDDVTHEKFVPTKEWQTIKPGQAIPAGLHVRMDLQNGKKEAKLLDENNPVDIKVNSVELKTETSQEGEKFNSKELKEALKLIKNDDVITPKEKMKKKFRSIEELKTDFASINMNIKTEMEILSELVKKYKSGDNKISALRDLEFLLHQYDLAHDFVKMGGINLLLPDFNSTESRIRSLVAFTLGSAMQSNPRVQISVLESNAMQLLLRLVSLDESLEVQARALYALSCLLRNFPAAQKNFIESGGITALAELFRPHKVSSLKLQVKVITLLHDLLSEQYLTEQYMEESDKIQQEKLRQYKSFQLETALKENGFCSLLPKLLSAPDHDTQEKVISAMQTLVATCRDTFARSLNSLKSLAESYKLAAALEEVEENDNEKHFSDSEDELYFLNLYSSVSDLISSVEPKHKDEL